MKIISQNIIHLLNKKVEQYNHIDFIVNDPISIPHQFTKKQDIEIAAFFSATLAWGNRKSIITSCKRLMNFMDNSPYDFIMNIDEDDIEWMQDFEHFVHRTFNCMDAIRFIDFLRLHYQFFNEESLETAFTRGLQPNDENVENALNGFYQYFFNTEYFADEIDRTKKHIAAPFKKSACKKSCKRNSIGNTLLGKFFLTSGMLINLGYKALLTSNNPGNNSSPQHFFQAYSMDAQ